MSVNIKVWRSQTVLTFLAFWTLNPSPNSRLHPLHWVWSFKLWTFIELYPCRPPLPPLPPIFWWLSPTPCCTVMSKMLFSKAAPSPSKESLITTHCCHHNMQRWCDSGDVWWRIRSDTHGNGRKWATSGNFKLWRWQVQACKVFQNFDPEWGFKVKLKVVWVMSSKKDSSLGGQSHNFACEVSKFGRRDWKWSLNFNFDGHSHSLRLWFSSADSPIVNSVVGDYLNFFVVNE